VYVIILYIREPRKPAAVDSDLGGPGVDQLPAPLQPQQLGTAAAASPQQLVAATSSSHQQLGGKFLYVTARKILRKR
jgi:hypothetical protein